MKEMRCRKHPTDLSSSIGVCATCLRQRLFTIIIASQQPEQQSHPLPFPRSVSPYISRRKSDSATWQQQTPLVNPTTTTTTTTKTKKPVRRLTSLFLSLFGSKSKKPDPDPIRKTFSVNRGMSPVRCSDAGEEITSGFSSVMRTPARVGNISSAFCLSPLVRPSPNRRTAFATENASSSSHLSFCKNRSRKLADIGRFWYSGWGGGGVCLPLIEGLHVVSGVEFFM